MKFNLKQIAAVTLIALGATSVAQAASFTASMWLSPTFPQSIHCYKNMFDRVREETKGKVNVETFYSGSLLPPKTVIQGVRDGVADIAFVYPAYTPAELPVTTFINTLTFTAKDSLAAGLAYTELVFTNETVKAELDSFNAIATGAYDTPSYHLMCNQEVKNLSEAKGKRFRTAGTAYTGFAAKLNSVAVSVPFNDVFSGLQRGNLDCTMADPTTLITASLNEVVKNITMVEMGGSTGLLWVINKKSWAKISEDNRVLLLNEMVRGIVATHVEWTEQTAKAFADAKKRGTAIQEPEADLAQALADYKKEFVASAVSSAEGVKNPQELMDEYNSLQEKWIGLLQGTNRTDVEAITAIVKKELLSKIDTKTFGIN